MAYLAASARIASAIGRSAFPCALGRFISTDRLPLGLVRDKSTVVAAAVAERLLASVRLAQQSVVSLFMRARHVQVRATLVGETQRGLLAPTIDAVGEDGPGRSLAVDSIAGGVVRRDALPVSSALRLHEVGLIQRSSPK